MSFYTQELLEAVNRWNGILPSPSREALKKPQGLRVFRSSILEYGIGRAHPIVPGLWVLPAVTYLLRQSFRHEAGWVTAALFFSAILFWTLLEYGIHAMVFHKRITPSMSPRLKMILFMLHGYHHEYPNDPGRLVMPIALAWPLGMIIGFVLWIFLGTHLFFGFFAGILAGYLGYDWMHYYTHHIRPKTKAGRYLHEFHAIHHFIDENRNFGISSPIWDWVFGKAKEPRLIKSHT